MSLRGILANILTGKPNLTFFLYPVAPIFVNTCISRRCEGYSGVIISTNTPPITGTRRPPTPCRPLPVAATHQPPNPAASALPPRSLALLSPTSQPLPCRYATSSVPHCYYHFATTPSLPPHIYHHISTTTSLPELCNHIIGTFTSLLPLHRIHYIATTRSLLPLCNSTSYHHISTTTSLLPLCNRHIATTPNHTKNIGV